MTFMSQQPPPGFGPPAFPATAAPQQWTNIVVVTTETFPGRTISGSLGEVIGVSVREREIDPKQDPTIAYPAMLLRSRQQAIARMADMARERGAHAVVGLRFDSSEITQDLSEVIAYGTAVQFAG